ncbi:MAG TPA: prenyltransferase/squalene oxidase repeat-containing protein [Planctomycetaceae bacterium]|jgi:hypothetical protein|nr:prenyltransferase/squalene oxidase repeat-containing protein [Planctomycetaceae bacterium]
MTASSVGRMRDMLLRWRGSGPGWGYRPESPPCAEPTVLASLALLASSTEDPGSAREHSPDCRAALDASAAWLASLQHADGSVGISAALPAPHWSTALALLLWMARDVEPKARRRAADWLLAQQGRAWERPEGTPFGHDTSIPGWAWVEGTHSWLEPTAWAILALERAGHHDHARVTDGRRLIRDRALRSGGWNYGNSQVFGTDLRPQPGPTGLALLALAGSDSPESPPVERGCDYLTRVLPATRAPQSLCWGLLGLAAFDRRPVPAEAWLESAMDKAVTRSDRSVQLAYLLLAAAPRALVVLGIERASPRPQQNGGESNASERSP